MVVCSPTYRCGETGTSQLDPDADPALDEGELYAASLGPPPQHGSVSVEIVDDDGTVVETYTYRYNCYAYEGDLP